MKACSLSVSPQPFYVAMAERPRPGLLRTCTGADAKDRAAQLSRTRPVAFGFHSRMRFH